MTLLHGTVLAVLIVMAMIWFYCLSSLSRQVRERHSDEYDEMELDDLWGFPDRRTLVALSRLFDGGIEALDDPPIRRLGIFMRCFAVVYFMLSVFLVISVESSRPAPETVAATPASASTSAPAPAPAPPSEADATYSRAVHHWRAGRLEEALADFRRVIELEPSNFNAYLQADHLLGNQRRWDEILPLWDAYLRVEPRDANAYYERGGTNYRRGDFAAAHADAAKACELGKPEACPWAEQLKSK